MAWYGMVSWCIRSKLPPVLAKTQTDNIYVLCIDKWFINTNQLLMLVITLMSLIAIYFYKIFLYIFCYTRAHTKYL